jgi:putative oxidoreductase
MKIAALIARIIMGLIFLVFGLNGFLNFMKGPLPPGLAGQFLGSFTQSHYDWLVSGAQIIGGALVLAAVTFRSVSRSWRQSLSTLTPSTSS